MSCHCSKLMFLVENSQGVVKAHEEAKEQYEKAIEQKQTAFLGEENKADIFKVSKNKIRFFLSPSIAKVLKIEL